MKKAGSKGQKKYAQAIINGKKCLGNQPISTKRNKGIGNNPLPNMARSLKEIA